MNPHASPLRARDTAQILGLFIGTRLIYLLLGLKFDDTTPLSFMQFIDLPLLRERLLESVWYLHSQPPLLNLFTGIGLKLFGDQAWIFYALCFHALGYALAVSVFCVTRRLTQSITAAYCATIIMVASPAFVLYENWLMYTFPTAALLGMATYFLAQYVDRRTVVWGTAFFATLACIALTRSLFHIVWLVGITGLLLLLLKPQRKQTLLAAIVPILAVLGWYAKNFVYFGVFSASTTMGLGLSNVTTLTVTQQELLPLVAEQRLSPFALVSRYTDTGILFASQQLEPRGIPVLDSVMKSTGHFNYNNEQMIAVNRFYTRDAITVARTFPFNYVVGVVFANRLFFSPSHMNEYFLEENKNAVRHIAPMFNAALYGAGPRTKYMVQPHFGLSGQPSLEVNTGIGLILAWIVLLPYCYVRARRALVSKTAPDLGFAIIVGFALINVIYVYLLGTALELAENYRYKFLIEPLFIVLATVAITDGLRALKTRMGLRSAPAIE